MFVLEVPENEGVIRVVSQDGGLSRRFAEASRRQAASLGGHLGAALQSSAAGSTPTTSSSDKSLPRPANHDSTTTKPAA